MSESQSDTDLLLEDRYLAGPGIQVFTWVAGIIVSILAYLSENPPQDSIYVPIRPSDLYVIIPLFGVILFGFFWDFRGSKNATKGFIAGLLSIGTTINWTLPIILRSMNVNVTTLAGSLFLTSGYITLSAALLLTGLVYFRIPDGSVNRALTQITGISFMMVGLIGIVASTDIFIIMFHYHLLPVFLQLISVPSFLGIIIAYSMMWKAKKEVSPPS